MIDGKVAYRALTSRDSRFDGVFYVGVTPTGIYYRPVCPARAPREENYLFFPAQKRLKKPPFAPACNTARNLRRVMGRLIAAIVSWVYYCKK